MIKREMNKKTKIALISIRSHYLLGRNSKFNQKLIKGRFNVKLLKIWGPCGNSQTSLLGSADIVLKIIKILIKVEII